MWLLDEQDQVAGRYIRYRERQDNGCDEAVTG